jgi:hypothetical protein
MDDCGLAKDVGPARHPRKRDGVTGGNLTGPVEDDSERALIVVVEKQDNAAGEVGIVKGRRRNQECTGERGIDHWSIMPTASRSCTSCLLNHGHQLTPMPSARAWPHDVISRPVAIGQPK